MSGGPSFGPNDKNEQLRSTLVGKQQRKKQEQRSLRRGRPDLLVKVREQRDLLRALGRAFDAGDTVVGYPLATTIRVMVHSTARSRSLLEQTGDQAGMHFIDTSLPISPTNLLAHAGLVIMQMTVGVGARWVPRMLVPGPSVPGAEPRNVTFGRWWTTDVTKDGSGILWSRQKVVLAITNKEGGSHIDPHQPLDIKAIEEENSMGWRSHDPMAGDQPMSNGPLLPSVRQIAYELETSVTTHFEPDIGP